MCWLGAVPPSQVRAQFGLRLKTFRLRAGFKTARAFAEALELDENRYSRYERGEVEPNLASICRMCSVLGVEPNDLFGLSQALGEPAIPAKEKEDARAEGCAKAKPGPSQAWRVASALASLRRESGRSSASASGDDPLASLRITTTIYARLLTNDPGHVVAEILNEAALDGIVLSRKADLASLIDAFMQDGAMPSTT